MFSGLTNQVSSWMGQVKGGENHDEEVPTPTIVQSSEPLEQTQSPQQQHQNQMEPQEENVALGDEEDKKQSPTKPGGGVFSSVKSQMSGWLGNASIPSMPSMPAMPAMPSMPSIPGLRKTNAGEGGEGLTNEGLATSPDQQNSANIGEHSGQERTIDDDDRSRYISATEGADSRPASGPGTPTEEQGGQIGQVTTKVTQGAKTFGSFLYSAVNKAGAKIKKTVEENNILGEFNKEQEAFAKTQGNAGNAVSPWVGHANEERIKEEILSLSADRRNFVRAPPAGVDFAFDYDSSYPTAVAIMTDDPALEKIRFELVPKIITEEHFWRNYFYRVSLICQASEFGTLDSGSYMPQGSSEDNEAVSKIVDKPDNKLIDEKSIETKKNKKVSESEFVSDTFQTTEKDLEEVKEGMRKLGIDTLVQDAVKTDEQWEKDLEAELQDFEVVNDGSDNKVSSNTDWEKDVDDLLGDDDDLK